MSDSPDYYLTTEEKKVVRKQVRKELKHLKELMLENIMVDDLTPNEQHELDAPDNLAHLSVLWWQWRGKRCNTARKVADKLYGLRYMRRISRESPHPRNAGLVFSTEENKEHDDMAGEIEREHENKSKSKSKSTGLGCKAKYHGLSNSWLTRD